MTPTRLLTDSGSLDEGFYVSEVESPGRLPVLTYQPTGFEPSYAYPLLVFLHGRGGSEKQLMRLAPRVSRRNYISIGLRGPELMRRFDDGDEDGYGWGQSTSADSYAEEYVFRAIEQACLMYPINEERVYLAGICEGAATAYRLGLAYPDKFAGVIALNGHIPAGGPLFRLPELRRLRVFIGHGIANSTVPLSVAKKDHRLLWTAGVPIELKTYPTTHRIHLDMLKDINRWVMDGVETAAT
jgi:phospholipase/carboxylesterase